MLDSDANGELDFDEFCHWWQIQLGGNKGTVLQDGLHALISHVENEAKSITKASRVVLYLVDNRRCEVWVPSGMGEEKTELIRHSWTEGIAGASALRGAIIRVDDAENDHRCTEFERPESSQHVIGKILAIPIQGVSMTDTVEAWRHASQGG